MQKIIAAIIMIAALAVAGTAGAAGEIYTGGPVDGLGVGDTLKIFGVDYQIAGAGTVSAHNPSPCEIYPGLIDPATLQLVDPNTSGTCGVIVEFGPGILFVSDTYHYATFPVTPTAEPPAAGSCTEATTDLERGTCQGRETMTTEARTGIIVGLEVY